MTGLARNSIHHADLFDLCAALDAGSVDMILADLPYGTTACSWDTVIPFAPMWAAFKRIIKPRGAIVLTASQPFTSALVMSWPQGFRYEWVWDKVAPVGMMNAKLQPMRQHENALVFCSEVPIYFPELTPDAVSKPFGKLSTSKPGVYGVVGANKQVGIGYPRSIVSFMRPNNLTGGGLHPTQKPVALFEYLIRTYTQPGELVFDPTAGSGTTAVAARQTGRDYIVGDSSAEYVALMQERLGKPYTLPMLELERTHDEA
jgi:site-specific DNA-methyltransferase (adenine-specific)